MRVNDDVGQVIVIEEAEQGDGEDDHHAVAAQQLDARFEQQHCEHEHVGSQAKIADVNPQKLRVDAAVDGIAVEGGAPPTQTTLVAQSDVHSSDSR